MDIAVKRARDLIFYFVREYTVAFLLLAIILFMSIARPDTFFRLSNFMNVIRVSSIVGIIACGMTFVLIYSGFDLSVGMIMSFSGVICVLAYEPLGPFLLFPWRCWQVFCWARLTA